MCLAHWPSQWLPHFPCLAQVRRWRPCWRRALDAIVTLDEQGKVIHVNPAAEKLFGYSLSDALGLDIGELIASPCAAGAGEPEFQSFTKNRGPILAQRLEMLALHANGSTQPVELTLVRLATQEPINYTAYVRDLSDQKRALACATRQ